MGFAGLEFEVEAEFELEIRVETVEAGTRVAVASPLLISVGKGGET